MFKKTLFILLLTLMSLSGYGQTVFTQTFVDRCTGDVRVVTANFVNGSATVAFYDKIKIFTYQQYLNGELQSWLIQTYEWWQALSPCSSTTQQVQQAQQTAQVAQQAAQTATTAASTAATAATSSVNVPPPPSNTTNTNATSSSNTTNSTSQNTSSGTSGGNESTGGTTGGGGGEGGTQSGGNSSEGSSSEGGQTTENKTEDKSTETKTESEGGSSDENKDTESKETESTEETKEESKEEVKEEEKKEEDKKEQKEKKKEEKKKEKEEKKKKSTLLPIQLKADMMVMQQPLGGFVPAMSFGASRSSIFGDVSYGANLMVFSNLKQATLGLNRSKVYMDDSYNVDWIESIGVNYGNNFGTQSTSGNFMRLKPMGKYGTVGLGVNYTYMFGGMLEKPMGSMGYNFLYTNSFVRADNRWTYSPAFIISQTPVSFTLDKYSNISGDAMFILANSFTYRITKRFTVNFGYTAIKSTNPLIPLISSFMIGSKLPF